MFDLTHIFVPKNCYRVLIFRVYGNEKDNLKFQQMVVLVVPYGRGLVEIMKNSYKISKIVDNYVIHGFWFVQLSNEFF